MHELLARGRIALAVVADEQPPVLLARARRAVLGRADMLAAAARAALLWIDRRCFPRPPSRNCV